MKKYTLLTILSAVALLASCNRVEPQPQPQVNGDNLILSLDSGSMVTKSAGTGFENVIDHFDFFFFDDAEGDTPTPGMHARVSGASTQLATGLGQTYEPLRLGTHYVYILANYPGGIDHTSDWKLEDILALEFESTIATTVKELNPSTGKEEETGEVTFCENLVMDSYAVSNNSGTITYSYTTELTPTRVQEEGEITIPLSRIAAKLNLTLNIEPSVTGTIGDTWTPILQELQAYYVNALNNKTTVGATPVNRASLDDESYIYYTYPAAYNIEATQEGGFTFVADPVYTYPQEWESGDNGEPYFKVFLPWMSNKRGTSNFYYKIAVPKPETGTKWTIDRNTCYNVAVDLSVVDAASDYVEVPGNYTIQDWGTGGEPGGNGLAAAKFFDVPVREFTMYSKESIDIPFSSSSAVTAYFTEVSYWYYGSTNGTHYHFRFDPANEVSQVYLPTDKDSDDQTLNVKNYAGVSVNAAKDLNQYKLEVAGKNVTFSHNLSEIFSVRTIKLVIKNQDGRSAEVIITQHPAIEVAAHNSKNMFLNGWYYMAREGVRDADGNLTGYAHTPTGNASMPHIPYWRTRSNWSSSGATLYGTMYAGGSTSVKADHYFLTEVSVSAFSETNNKYKVREGSNTGAITEKAYRLGDPRVPASTHYNSSTATGTTPRFVLKNYLYSDKARRQDNGDGTYTQLADASADVTKAWEEPLKVLIATQKTEDQNIIAPRLLVSSHLNITSGVNWNNSDGTGVVQRCAIYQEAGYPAGRWRLPTEAEFAFMMQLQSDGTLPGLFADNCYYRIADGRRIHVGTDGNVTPYVASNSGTVYIRMVYDLWYWGDNPTDGVLQIHPESEMTEWEKAIDPVSGEPNWKTYWADYYHPNMHEH